MRGFRFRNPLTFEQFASRSWGYLSGEKKLKHFFDDFLTVKSRVPDAGLSEHNNRVNSETKKNEKKAIVYAKLVPEIRSSVKFLLTFTTCRRHG